MPTDYSKYPFISKPSPERHPDYSLFRLELGGLESPRWKSALEIGCGQGSLLNTLAWFNQDKEFAGIDENQHSIEIARQTAKDLGLNNVSFKVCSLENFNSEKSFDLTLAYGVYSWIPQEAQRNFLELLSNLVGDTGFAIINHNLSPGWDIRSELTEILKEKCCETPVEVREVLSEIGESSVHGLRLAEEARNIVTEASDGLIVHELLNPDSSSCSSTEFKKTAADFGMSVFDPVSDVGIAGIPPVERITERSIRNIVLRKEFTPRVGEISLLDSAWFTSKFVAADSSEHPSLFYSPEGAETKLDARSSKIINLLSENWPDSLPYSELAKSLPAEIVGKLLIGGVLDVFSCKLPVSNELNFPWCSPVSIHPSVFPGVQVNCRLEYVSLNDRQIEFLRLCNGKNSLSNIREDLGMSETDCLDAIQMFQEMALLIVK